METQLHEIVAHLIADHKIDLCIGYERGSVPLKSRPFFLRVNDAEHPEQLVEKLVWNAFCSNNLAVFLPKYFECNPFARTHPPKPTIGMVVKGCDLRSVVTLVKEKQVPRENLVLIGVPCQGMIDRRKVFEAVSGNEITDYQEEDGRLHVTVRSGQTYTFQKDDILQDACRDCRYPMPEGTDYLLDGSAKEPGTGGYGIIDNFEGKTVQERWNYFQQEMSKCIRCYACRQVCPTCWCKECFAEQTDLKWIGMSADISDTMLFHLTRIFHQAGRCVECDACYRACPMNIDLRTFTKKIGKDVESLFEFYPDFDQETVPPISTFNETDSDAFITEP